MVSAKPEHNKNTFRLPAMKNARPQIIRTIWIPQSIMKRCFSSVCFPDNDIICKTLQTIIRKQNEKPVTNTVAVMKTCGNLRAAKTKNNNDKIVKYHSDRMIHFRFDISLRKSINRCGIIIRLTQQMYPEISRETGITKRVLASVKKTPRKPGRTLPPWYWPARIPCFDQIFCVSASLKAARSVRRLQILGKILLIYGYREDIRSCSWYRARFSPTRTIPTEAVMK